jgi:hypothetical protein
MIDFKSINMGSYKSVYSYSLVDKAEAWISILALKHLSKMNEHWYIDILLSYLKSLKHLKDLRLI